MDGMSVIAPKNTIHYVTSPWKVVFVKMKAADLA